MRHFFDIAGRNQGFDNVRFLIKQGALISQIDIAVVLPCPQLRIFVQPVLLLFRVDLVMHNAHIGNHKQRLDIVPATLSAGIQKDIISNLEGIVLRQIAASESTDAG